MSFFKTLRDISPNFLLDASVSVDWLPAGATRNGTVTFGATGACIILSAIIHSESPCVLTTMRKDMLSDNVRNSYIHQTSFLYNCYRRLMECYVDFSIMSAQ